MYKQAESKEEKKWLIKKKKKKKRNGNIVKTPQQLGNRQQYLAVFEAAPPTSTLCVLHM